MKCDNCGHENKNNAKFCTKCGKSLDAPSENVPAASSSDSKGIIVALVIVIIILAAVIGYFAFAGSDFNSQASADSNEVTSDDNSNDDSDSAETTDSAKTSVSSKNEPKEWVSIGSYSGSGTGSETIKVPKGKIKVELSAYPILNYATNHLYVTGTNGESGGVDWGSTSAVETRSDSFEFNSDSEEEFTIDYYETVSWEVEFYRYQ